LGEPQRIASSDGVSLALHDLGGDGPPLLILHATGFAGMAYAALGRALAAGFHVRAIDFRGHGDSTRPEGERFEWGAFAEDLLAVIDVLAAGSEEPPAVFGHSLGGAVALLAELRRPRSISWAYLYEPIVLPELFPQLLGSNPIADGARRRRASFPSRAEAMWRYAGRPPLDVLQAGALASYVEHGFAELPDGSVRLKCRPEDEAATFSADGKPTLEMLAALALPTVVAAGAVGDGFSPGELSPEIAAALPAGRLERYPDLGHMGPLENPAAVAARVLAAAAELSR
jgi:pimeloyl-ACP methyl ester carboxylesterase